MILTESPFRVTSSVSGKSVIFLQLMFVVSAIFWGKHSFSAKSRTDDHCQTSKLAGLPAYSPNHESIESVNSASTGSSMPSHVIIPDISDDGQHHALEGALAQILGGPVGGFGL